MTSIEKIKRIFDNFLETRVYNYYKAKKKKKAISNDRRKYKKICDELNKIKKLKKVLNRKILLNCENKKSFNDLHFLKMLEHYIYLRFYHENIQKLNYNEKLLRYFEKIIIKGFNPIKWDQDYYLLVTLEDIINLLPS